MRIQRLIVSAVIAFGAIGIPLVAPAATFAATATPAAPATAMCTDGNWPATVEGQPTAFHAGAAAGDYIWHSSDGWQLRVTHPGSAKVVFTGQIVSSAPLTARPVALEASDWFAVSPDRRVITFRFTNYGHIDGINFRTDCALHLTFHLAMAGTALPITQIWLGRANTNPTSNPFTESRSS